MENQRSGVNTEQTLDFLDKQEFPSVEVGLCRVGGQMCWEGGYVGSAVKKTTGESPSTSQTAHSWVPTIQKRNGVPP